MSPFFILFCLLGQPPADSWKSHWAAQPTARQPLPSVKQKDWPNARIDYFILRQLEEHELQPSPPADRRTLLRRASYDLTGLPPTPEEIQEFENDASPEAFVNVVDRLLASPHYGERWGRYWLDVARYADSKGYVRLQEEPRYHYAYTYRDYVVRSLNADLPYDQFLLEQLAADQLSLTDDNRPLAALGFLTLGRRFTSNKHDIIDDRIDVVTRGLMGLTVTCARCHDHKYDPIPIADYYSLYGLFASTREPANLPLIGGERIKPVFYGDRSEYLHKREELEKLQQTKHTALLNTLRADTSRYLVQVLEGRKTFLVPMPAETTDVRPTFVELWIDYIQGASRRQDPIFTPWHALAVLGLEEFSQKAPDLLRELSRRGPDDRHRVNPRIVNALDSAPLASMADVARTYGELFISVHNQWQSLLAQDPRATGLADPDEEELRQVLYGPTGPFAITSKEAVAAYLYDARLNTKLAKAQNKFDLWLMETGQAPDRAHVLVDAPAPYEPNIFIRGNPDRPGPIVPRRFLSLLTEGPRKTFAHGKGRWQLARAITDRNNPLTARVLVNRVWLQHFGNALVSTPSNFGLRGERPSHPALLDDLARQLIDGGWSIKDLHRSILLSSTYQQSSKDRPECRQVDPSNQLCWKMNRRHLDFEMLRDSMLWAADRLDLSMGGPPAPLTGSTNVRRTIYGTIDRLDLPGMMRTFDFCSPDTHSPGRFSTTVPQQALFLMNNPFVLEQAQALVGRVKDRAKPDTAEASPAETIARLYALVLGRKPTASQTVRALDFIQDDASWTELAQVLLLSNQFLFVD